MDKYIGVKIISAEPMTAPQFNKEIRPLKYSGEDQSGYKVVYEDGYTSWSPKDVFEKAYRRINNMTFGLALEALKQGKKVCRAAWNGKKQFIELATNVSNICDVNHKQIGTWEIKLLLLSGQLEWIASQTDMLSEDWMIVE